MLVAAAILFSANWAPLGGILISSFNKNLSNREGSHCYRKAGQSAPIGSDARYSLAWLGSARLRLVCSRQSKLLFAIHSSSLQRERRDLQAGRGSLLLTCLIDLLLVELFRKQKTWDDIFIRYFALWRCYSPALCSFGCHDGINTMRGPRKRCHLIGLRQRQPKSLGGITLLKHRDDVPQHT